MAVIPMQKIRIFGHLGSQDKLLKLLQKRGDIEITNVILQDDVEGWQKIPQANHETELTVANLEFCIKLLKPYEKKRSLLAGPRLFTVEKVKSIVDDFDYKKIVEKCREIEEKMVANRNVLFTLPTEQDLNPWLKLELPVDEARETENYLVSVGTVPNDQFESLQKEIAGKNALTEIHLVNHDDKTTYLTLIYDKSLDTEIKEIMMNHKFSEAEFGKSEGTPEEILEFTRERKKELEKEISELEKQLAVLGKETENLKIAYDYFVWQRDQQSTKYQLARSEFGTVLEGWALKPKLENLKSFLEKAVKDIEIVEVARGKDEKPPVKIENRAFLRPIEFVTKIYGLPAWNSVDPTPYLSFFFIIFFGLCLSDAGYGIILFLLSLIALKVFKIPKDTGSHQLFTLLLWGGIVTFFAGIVTGGWLGLTPEQAPGFLVESITNDTGQTILAFKYQLLNPTAGNGPMTFLIISLILGVIHLAFGLIIDFFFKLKNGQIKEAFLDTFAWFYFLATLITYGLSVAGVLSADLAPIFSKLALAGALILVITQGRSQKNIFGKIGIGILSLYNVVGYVADILSYSRIMALGLATGVVAFAMNTIAGIFGGMIPYVGFLVAIFIILLGHVMNILISTLGAFVHSARLQFVEFFSKFLEGGGQDFKPFHRACKYIYIREN